MSLFHNLFGQHLPDVEANRWDRGNFVSRCEVCRRAMIKLPGLGWQIQQAAA